MRDVLSTEGMLARQALIILDRRQSRRVVIALNMDEECKITQYGAVMILVAPDSSGPVGDAALWIS